MIPLRAALLERLEVDHACLSESIDNAKRDQSRQTLPAALAEVHEARMPTTDPFGGHSQMVCLSTPYVYEIGSTISAS